MGGQIIKPICKGFVIFEPNEADVLGVGWSFNELDGKTVGIGAGRALGFGQVGVV